MDIYTGENKQKNLEKLPKKNDFSPVDPFGDEIKLLFEHADSDNE